MIKYQNTDDVSPVPGMAGGPSQQSIKRDASFKESKITIADTGNARNLKLAKLSFHKRRQTFDQKFISEEDRPLDSSRLVGTYYPCESNSNYQTTIPNHQGKFLYKSRLPQI